MDFLVIRVVPGSLSYLNHWAVRWNPQEDSFGAVLSRSLGHRFQQLQPGTAEGLGRLSFFGKKSRSIIQARGPLDILAEANPRSLSPSHSVTKVRSPLVASDSRQKLDRRNGRDWRIVSAGTARLNPPWALTSMHFRISVIREVVVILLLCEIWPSIG